LFNAKGMAQRGGRVTSEIRISTDQDFEYGSRISADEADILVGMELGETANSWSYLKTGGLLLLLDHASVPTQILLKKQSYPGIDQVLDVFSRKTDALYAVTEPHSPYNIFLLGVLGALLESQPELLSGWTCGGLRSSIEKNLKRNIDENLEVFEQGCRYGRTVGA
jgi:Pyruvate/2-oxoacid:ferredoxin oxidoreductase gamma subunit